MNHHHYPQQCFKSVWNGLELFENLVLLTMLKNGLKQEILAKSQRIRPYEKRQRFFEQSKQFVFNPKRFYQELGKNKIEINAAPTAREVEEFREEFG